MRNSLKHHFMSKRVQLTRLLEIFDEHKTLVVAVDFDNTLFDFHHNKEKHVRTEYDFSLLYTQLARLKDVGCYIIIWTANEDTDFIKRFLEEKKIPYDAINENPPFFKSTSRKIYYNVLLDDAAGLQETYLLLNRFLNTTERFLFH